jgi:hypothetical protein
MNGSRVVYLGARVGANLRRRHHRTRKSRFPKYFFGAPCPIFAEIAPHDTPPAKTTLFAGRIAALNSAEIAFGDFSQ